MQVVPDEVDTIADLQKLVPLLSEKGYSKDDIIAIMGGNWLRHLRHLLPEKL
jgi:membrane dipeptidase